MRLNAVLEVGVDGRPVALGRMLMAFALAVCALESAHVLGNIAAGNLRYPVISLLPAPSALGVQLGLMVGLLAAVCLFLGLFAGISAATGSALLASALVWDQQTYSSHHVLVMLLLAYLAFARSGARWSIPAARGARQVRVPWWPQLLMMTQVTVLYLFAGLSKINPVFLSGGPLRGWMWIELPLPVFQLLAVATVVTEIFLAVALWIPRVRVLAVVAGLGLHISIVVGLTDQTLVLIAFAAASMSTYWLFLSRPTLREMFVAGNGAGMSIEAAVSR